MGRDDIYGEAKSTRQNGVALPTGFCVSVQLGPDPGGTHPPTPAARIKRAYKLRQQPAETPGAWTARGFFFVAVNAQKDILLICCSKVTGRGQNLPIRLTDTSSPLSRF
jgi:hypothetical protein